MDGFQRRVQLYALFQREKGRCFWCKKTVRLLRRRGRRANPPADMATRDHIFLASKFGSDSISNLVLSCFGCNSERGKIPADVFAVMKWGIGAQLPAKFKCEPATEAAE